MKDPSSPEVNGPLLARRPAEVAPQCLPVLLMIKCYLINLTAASIDAPIVTELEDPLGSPAGVSKSRADAASSLRQRIGRVAFLYVRRPALARRVPRA